jgi:SAM-dependent methyltransferase
MIYQSINQAVFERIPSGTRSLLDVGCGGGVFGAAVKSARACTVVGVTYSEAEAVQARERLDRVEVADLNDFEPRSLGTFDCIVCSHVLEHMQDPQQVLSRLLACVAPGGMLLVALPNVLFWKQRLDFLRGRFRYTEGGLMDRTHVRFFDWYSADQLVRDAGFEVIERVADGVFPLSRLFGSALSGRINRAALRQFPGLFGVQFVLHAVPAAA